MIKKIDRRKKYVIVLDVETANMSEDALVYDLGFGVYDKEGNEYESYSKVITNIFDKESDLMQSAYYHEKLPKYYEELEKGSRERIGILQAKKLIREVMEKYNINEVYAYNANFDLNALNKTIRYVTKSKVRYFFPYGTKVCCIWHMACQTLCLQKTFQKQNIRNANGNLITNAERVYSYIMDIDFQEEHTGLEDTRIEAKIMAWCFKQHKKMARNINRACWRIPNLVELENVA
jgi:hypothetical protein